MSDQRFSFTDDVNMELNSVSNINSNIEKKVRTFMIRLTSQKKHQIF